MHKFIPGDKVFANKPAKGGKFPEWHSELGPFLNKKLTVSRYLGNSEMIRLVEDGHSWLWDEAWLTLVEPFEGNV